MFLNSLRWISKCQIHFFCIFLAVLCCASVEVSAATAVNPTSGIDRQGADGSPGGLGNAVSGGNGSAAPGTAWSSGNIELGTGEFTGNRVIGGAGGTGGQGDVTSTNGRKGGAGGVGGNAEGGIGYTSGSISAVNAVTLEENAAVAGAGGQGGSGGNGTSTGNGASGGNGGQGGEASGGALGTNDGIGISGGGIIKGNRAVGGNGGNGGATGLNNAGNTSSSRQYGAGGGSGGNARGGALYSGVLTSISGASVTFSDNAAIGGNAGIGADGGIKSTALSSGNGGTARGGSIYAGGGVLLDADTSVLSSRAIGGAGGIAGNVYLVLPADLGTSGINGINGGIGGQAQGGGIYSAGSVSGTGSLEFNGNAAIGGSGGAGGSAAVSSASGAGGQGGSANGGAIYGLNMALRGMFTNNLALGGSGGRGGSGAPAVDPGMTSNGIRGGIGGSGGEAKGGALYDAGNLHLGMVVLSGNQSVGGSGGDGGTGGAASGAGNGGQGGNGGAGGAAFGGGAYAATVILAGGTVTGNQAVGGKGGNGAQSGTPGPAGGSSQVAGDGGSGGNASGGAFYSTGTTTSTGSLNFTGNKVVGGHGGDGAYAPGSSSSGPNSHGGAGGSASGGALYSGGLLTLGASSVFEGNSAQGGSGGLANESDKGGSVGGTGGTAQGGSIFSNDLVFSGTLDFIGSQALGGDGGLADSNGKQNVGGTGGNALGGAIYSRGSVNGSAPASFWNTLAQGGAGQDSSKGGRRKDGGVGGAGGKASGGAVFAVQTITLNGLMADSAHAVGGNGGKGGKGGNPDKDPGFTGPGIGGTGGAGGEASGGALYGQTGTINLTGADIRNSSAVGGAGGTGGAGNEGSEFYAASAGGAGGAGGDALGGAVYSGGNFIAVSSVFSGNSALGGNGGAGGKDNGGGAGVDGAGGRGYGGALYLKGAMASLQNVSFLNNTASTLGGAVFVNLSGANSTVNISADSGSQSIFQGNTAGGLSNSIAFASIAGSASPASSNVTLNFSGAGDIYLYDPLYVATTGTFDAVKTGAGTLAWGGDNILSTSATTISLNGGVTRLLSGFALKGSPFAMAVNGSSTVLRMEQSGPLTLDSGSSLTLGTGTTLSIEMGDRALGSSVFSTSGGGSLAFSNNDIFLTWNPVKPLNDIQGSWQMVDGSHSGSYQYTGNNSHLMISGDGIISGYYASPYRKFYDSASANGKRAWNALNEYLGRHPEMTQKYMGYDTSRGYHDNVAMYAASVSGMTPELYANQGRLAMIAQGRTGDQALALAFGSSGTSVSAEPASLAGMTLAAHNTAYALPHDGIWSGYDRYDCLTGNRKQVENNPVAAWLSGGQAASQLGRTNLSDKGDDKDEEPFYPSGSGQGFGGGMRLFSGALGNFMNRNGGDGYGGYRYTSGGIVAGLALTLSPEWEAGGYAGMSRGRMEDDDTESHSSVDGAHFGLFARYTHASGFKATTDLAYSHFWNYGTRKFYLGESEQRYDNKYQQDIAGLGLELAYDLNMAERTRLTPYVGARYAHLWQDDFRENAKNGSIADLALHTDAARADSLRSNMGLRFARDFQPLENLVLTPSAHAGWLHEWADNDVRLTSTLAGQGPSFTSRSASDNRDEIRLGVGLDSVLHLNKEYDLGIRAGYAVDLRAEGQDHGIFLNMELSF